METEYLELSDRELFEELQKADLADKLETSPEWRMLKEAANRIIDRAVLEFACKVKANDLPKIIELQTVIRKYRFGLINEVDILKQESKYIYQSARDRGLIGILWDDVKGRVGL